MERNTTLDKDKTFYCPCVDCLYHMEHTLKGYTFSYTHTLSMYIETDVYFKPSQLSPSIQYCTLPVLEKSSSTLGSSQDCTLNSWVFLGQIKSSLHNWLARLKQSGCLLPREQQAETAAHLCIYVITTSVFFLPAPETHAYTMPQHNPLYPSHSVSSCAFRTREQNRHMSFDVS